MAKSEPFTKRLFLIESIEYLFAVGGWWENGEVWLTCGQHDRAFQHRSVWGLSSEAAHSALFVPLS